MKIGVVTFPGSLDDVSALRAIELAGGTPVRLFHASDDLKEVQAVVLPGGFSYGDYLRCGAIAARSPIMRAVVESANKGTPVFGVCNGFQVLAETGLLPGALMRNRSLNFVCRDVNLEVANTDSAFTRLYEQGETIRIPVAHHDGNYFADADTLDRLEGEGRVAFRYAEDVNGSASNIAGVLNEKRNVLGMMPHPERRIEAAHGGRDGRALFESLMGQFEDEANKAERLLIVPDGPLDALPFSALARNPAGRATFQYLVDWKPIIFEPSVVSAAAVNRYSPLILPLR